MDSFDRPPPVGVFPDFGAINSPGLSAVVGALMTITLLPAVLMLIVGAVGWAMSSAAGNAHVAARFRTGAFVALAAAVLDVARPPTAVTSAVKDL
jgi:hypothetical protein